MQNIHPYFVHFPVAILSVGLLWDILGIIFKKDSLLQAGWWAQLFGTITILAAVGTGLIAEITVAHNDASHSIMETHKTIEMVAAGLFAGLFIVRSLLKKALPAKRAFLILYVVVAVGAVGTMLTGAHFGGILVYEFGVGGSAVSQVEGSAHYHEPGDGTEQKDEDEHDDSEEKDNAHQH